MCGLFGVVAYNDVASFDDLNKLLFSLGKASEVRGTDAGGLSYVDNGKLMLVKNSGAISTNGTFNTHLVSPIVMGHTRYGTGASEKLNFNNHPFPSTLKPFTMAHNGIISNDYELAKEYDLKDSKITTDSYIVVRMLDKLHGGVVNFDTLKDVSEKLEGSFNLTFQQKNALWIVKHNNPLVIMNSFKLGAYIYASTKEILLDAIDRFYDGDALSHFLTSDDGTFGEFIDINSGDILRISSDGAIDRKRFKPKPTVYKAYPRYNYYGSYASAYDQYVNDYYDNYDSCMVDYPKDDDRLMDLWDIVYEDKSDKNVEKALIYNSVETEVVDYFEGASTVYSDFLGRDIDIDDTDILFVATKDDIKYNFTLKDFPHIDPVVFGKFIKKLKNQWDYLDLIKLIENSRYPKNAIKLLKTSINLFLYVSWTFDTGQNMPNKDVNFNINFDFVMDEIIKMSVMQISNMYEYVQVSLLAYNIEERGRV